MGWDQWTDGVEGDDQRGDEYAEYQRRHRRDNPWDGWLSQAAGQGRGRGQQGGPPWLSGLMGLVQGDAQSGPKVRRGDVRMAILSVVASAGEAGEPVNGYQVIQQIAERSRDQWKPSPGSVYPTIQQLQDEGLVESDDEHGRRSLRLTDVGREYVADRADDIDAVWAPFDRTRAEADPNGPLGEVGQVLSAIWQITKQGSDSQKRALAKELTEMRRRLYGILADGPERRDDG